MATEVALRLRCSMTEIPNRVGRRNEVRIVGRDLVIGTETRTYLVIVPAIGCLTSDVPLACTLLGRSEGQALTLFTRSAFGTNGVLQAELC